MKLFKTSLFVIAATSMIACGHSKKSEDKKEEPKKEEEAPKVGISAEEMEARGKVYNTVPKNILVRVKLDANGKELTESAEMRYAAEPLSALDAETTEKSFAGA